MDFTPDTLLQQLKKGNFSPVYFLQGTEPYELDRISDYFTHHLLPPRARSFDLTVLYGKDHALDQVLAQARRLPMSGQHQVVIVKEAQSMAALQRTAQHAPLVDYLEQPNPHTLLVFVYRDKTLDKRSKLYKTLQQKGTVLTTQPLYERQVPAWLSAYVETQGRTLTPDANRLLQAAIGTRLQVLANELDKLLLQVPAGGTLDADLVEQYIGVSREHNAFALQQALGEGNAHKALLVAQYMGSNPKANPIIPTLALLFSFFNKLLLVHQARTTDKSQLAQVLRVSPYFVKDYVTAARHYSLLRVQQCLQQLHHFDCQVKGIDAPALPPEQLLKEMVAKLL